MILHPSTAERHEHRRYQRKLGESGIIPPVEATKPQPCQTCGEEFDPGRTGVTRWPEEDGEVRYSATCPHCRSTRFVYCWRPRG